MSKGDDGLVIDIVDDDAGTVSDTVKKEAPVKPAKVDVSNSLESLRQKLAAVSQQAATAERARVEAEKRAAQSEETVSSAKADAILAQHGAITSGLDSAKKRLETLEREHQSALESGDYKTATRANSDMGRVQAEIVKFEDSKAYLDDQIKTGANAPKKEPVKVEPTSEDRFEQTIGRLPAKSQAWLREHPETINDPELNHLLQAADVAARTKKGFTFESPEYFAYLEERLGLNGADDDDGDAEETEVKPKGKMMQSAPVHRDAPSQSNGKTNGQRVSLTKAEVEMAEAMGMTKEDYARNKLRAISEGRYEKM